MSGKEYIVPTSQYINPLTGLQVIQYAKDVVVKLTEQLTPNKPGWGLRGEIVRWSRASMRRFMLRVRNSCDWQGLITLTYPYEYTSDGEKVKDHLNAFLQYLRRRKVRYCWILEFQRRGAPHFHILVSDYVPKDEIALRWYKIVGSDDEDHLRAGTRVEGVKGGYGGKEKLIRYLFSYLKKGNQKDVPEEYQNVGRFWGSTRGILKEVTRIVTRCKEFESRKVLRIVRKYYEHRCKEWGFKWKWRNNRGFIGWGCAGVLNTLLDGQQRGKYIRACFGWSDLLIDLREKRHYRLTKNGSGFVRDSKGAWVLSLLDYERAASFQF